MKKVSGIKATGPQMPNVHCANSKTSGRRTITFIILMRECAPPHVGSASAASSVRRPTTSATQRRSRNRHAPLWDQVEGLATRLRFEAAAMIAWTNRCPSERKGARHSLVKGPPPKGCQDFTAGERPWSTMPRPEIELVERQLVRRGILDSRVLAAVRHAPRECFLPDDLGEFAYDDGPLPIGEGQAISQPYIVALMAEAARLKGRRSSTRGRHRLVGRLAAVLLTARRSKASRDHSSPAGESRGASLLGGAPSLSWSGGP